MSQNPKMQKVPILPLPPIWNSLPRGREGEGGEGWMGMLWKIDLHD